MGGILAVAGREAGSPGAAASRIAAGMRLLPWDRPRLLEPLPGRVFLGVVDDEQGITHQTDVHVAGEVTALVAGRIWRARQSVGADAPLAAGRPAAAVAAAYAARDDGFAEALEGVFTAVVCDLSRGRILFGNCRYGYQPLYCWRGQGIAAFGSQLGPLAASGLFRPRLDGGAVSEFLAFGQYFGPRTAVAGVTVMPPATVLELGFDDPSGWRLRSYWDFGRLGPKQPARNRRRLLDTACDLVDAAADRVAAQGPRQVSGLSGGMDSRLVTGLAAKRTTGLTAWTFGAPGATDLGVAHRVCERLGLEHLVYPSDPGEIAEFADLFVSITNGQLSAMLAFGRRRREDLRTRAPVALNGYAGETMLGDILLGPKAGQIQRWLRWRLGRGPEAPHPWVERNRGTRSLSLFLRDLYGRRSGLADLLTVPAPPVEDLIRTQLETELAGVPEEYAVEQWVMNNRGRRWTMSGIIGDRPWYDDASPFYDYDLSGACYALSPAVRRGRRLYIAVMKRLVPSVAGITYSNTGLPATTPLWLVTATKASRRAGNALRGGRRWVGTAGTDAQSWTRGPLRPFLEDLLGDPRARQREVWNGDELQHRLRLHMAGERDFGAELGLVATLELFARRWLDGASAERGRSG